MFWNLFQRYESIEKNFGTKYTIIIYTQGSWRKNWNEIKDKMEALIYDKAISRIILVKH